MWVCATIIFYSSRSSNAYLHQWTGLKIGAKHFLKLCRIAINQHLNDSLQQFRIIDITLGSFSTYHIRARKTVWTNDERRYIYVFSHGLRPLTHELKLFLIYGCATIEWKHYTCIIPWGVCTNICIYVYMRIIIHMYIICVCDGWYNDALHFIIFSTLFS